MGIGADIKFEGEIVIGREDLLTAARQILASRGVAADEMTDEQVGPWVVPLLLAGFNPSPPPPPTPPGSRAGPRRPA